MQLHIVGSKEGAWLGARCHKFSENKNVDAIGKLEDQNYLKKVSIRYLESIVQKGEEIVEDVAQRIKVGYLKWTKKKGYL